jgi:hypothetical protein
VRFKLSSLFFCIAKDVSLDPFTTQYCLRRLESEGITFWTRTLPNFSKYVLRSLEKGYFDYRGITNIARQGRSLRYFRSFLNEIFDKSSGKVLPPTDSAASALRRLRQLCEYLYKLALPFTESQLSSATQSFIKVEQQVKDLDVPPGYVELLRKNLETYYLGLAKAVVTDVLQHNRPRNPTGTFSSYGSFERCTRKRWYFRRYMARQLRVQDRAYMGFFKPYPSSPTVIEFDNDPEYSEVLFVPKDSRGPRTIVREPYHRLTKQLAFHDWCKNVLTKTTHGRVNFADQSVNQALACVASIRRHLVTLDLKEASDRVKYQLIKLLVRNCPALRHFIADRTGHTLLPDGRIVKLHKLAGMGSGLTFPIMSLLIHLTICTYVAQRTPYSYKELMKLVYIYGDDIIVPKWMYGYALEALSLVGLYVNVDKCYVHSHFRESCGGDYYNGNDVAPTRLKLQSADVTYCDSYIHVDGNLSTLAVERHCRELVKNGFTETSNLLYKGLESKVGFLPYVRGESPVLGRYLICDAEDMPYLEDSSGNYETLRVIVPIPAIHETSNGELDPYVYLSNGLSKNANPKLSSVDIWIELLGSDQDLKYGTVGIPYKVRYSRKRVSAFRLLG